MATRSRITLTAPKRLAAATVAIATGVGLVAGGIGVAEAAATPSLDAAAATAATTAITACDVQQVDAVTYADRLVRAWGRGDRTTAARYATESVTSALFAYSYPGGGYWRRTGTEGTAGTIFATYHDDARAGTLTIGVSKVILGQGGSHAAYTARFSQPWPISAEEYADRLVRAWGRGDHGAAAVYATDQVLRTLFGHADPGGGHWRRVSSDGAAGTTYVTYHDDAGGRTLTLGVSNVGLGEGQMRNVYRAGFGS